VHFTTFTLREICPPSMWLLNAAVGRYESPYLKGSRPTYYVLLCFCAVILHSVI